MGVQGIGKSTIGQLLAERLGVPFVDGDELHPERNITLMASGQPLSDEDREPWLDRVGSVLAEHQESGGVVIACSALKRVYRDQLRGHVPETFFLEPYGPMALVAARIAARDHEFMPGSLLESQYKTLEPLAEDEYGVRLSITPTPGEIVDAVLETLESRSEELA
jgi:gluconokinase